MEENEPFYSAFFRAGFFSGQSHLWIRIWLWPSDWNFTPGIVESGLSKHKENVTNKWLHLGPLQFEWDQDE